MSVTGTSFGQFERELLKFAYDASLVGDHNLSLRDLVKRSGLSMQDGWGAMALANFSERSLIKGLYGVEGPEGDMVIGLTGNGMRQAEVWIEEDRPKTFSEHLADEKFQKIGNLSISVLSLVISAGALIASIIALGKAG